MHAHEVRLPQQLDRADRSIRCLGTSLRRNVRSPAEEDARWHGRWPTVWGDSIGHWERDTLVIETVSVQNPPDYFFLAPPLSEMARYVERLRMTGRDRIDSDITIEDPKTLTQPWKVKMVYRRAEGIDRLLHDAYTNDRTGFDGELLTIEPPKP